MQASDNYKPAIAPAAGRPEAGQDEATTTTAISVRPSSSSSAGGIGIPKLLVSLDEVEANVKEFQAFKKRLILSDKANYQVVKRYNNETKQYEDHNYITKSGWRLTAAAFGISCTIAGKIKDVENEPDEKGRINFTWRVTVQARLESGRVIESEGACSSREKRFQSQYYDWGKIEHDTFATAETRAKNRAISDLVGAGEVSAEEVDSDDAHSHAAAPPPAVMTATHAPRPLTAAEEAAREKARQMGRPQQQ